MGPRHRGRGNSISTSLGIRQPGCFNGAASQRTRKLFPVGAPQLFQTMLQWGRVTEDAEIGGLAMS